MKNIVINMGMVPAAKKGVRFDISMKKIPGNMTDKIIPIEKIARTTTINPEASIP